MRKCLRCSVVIHRAWVWLYCHVTKLYFSVSFKVELYRMVRQLHLRTQGDQESSSAHPDIIGDRCVFVTEKR